MLESLCLPMPKVQCWKQHMYLEIQNKVGLTAEREEFEELWKSLEQDIRAIRLFEHAWDSAKNQMSLAKIHTNQSDGHHYRAAYTYFEIARIARPEVSERIGRWQEEIPERHRTTTKVDIEIDPSTKYHRKIWLQLMREIEDYQAEKFKKGHKSVGDLF